MSAWMERLGPLAERLRMRARLVNLRGIKVVPLGLEVRVAVAASALTGGSPVMVQVRRRQERAQVRKG